MTRIAPRSRCYRLALLLFCCAFLAAPATADKQPNAGAVLLDVLVARPISLAVAAGSTGLFVGTMALTVPIGVSHDAAYWLMAAPWRYTASRQPGVFDRYLDGRDIRGFATETPRAKRIRQRHEASGHP